MERSNATLARRSKALYERSDGLPRDKFSSELLREYFYVRLSELCDKESELIAALRTKRELLVLSDKLRALELEKLIVTQVYEELRLFF